MRVGDYVTFTPQPRPEVICPNCEYTSEQWGEKDQLLRCVDRIGVIRHVLDPQSPIGVKCGHCGESAAAPPHFAECGIAVRFLKRALDEPKGVWAYPSELTIIAPPRRSLLMPWKRGG
jgi:hypothetical protein